MHVIQTTKIKFFDLSNTKNIVNLKYIFNILDLNTVDLFYSIITDRNAHDATYK